MRRIRLSVFVAIVGFGVTLIAENVKPSAAMQAVMRSNAAANAEVREAAKAGDFERILAVAGDYKANLAYIDAYFTHENVAVAAEMARTGMKAVLELEAAAMKRDQAGVDRAVMAVGGACGSCHKQFREQLPDKTYEIRLP